MQVSYILVSVKKPMSSSLGIVFLFKMLQRRTWSGQGRTCNFHSSTLNGGKWLLRTLSRLHQRNHGLEVAQLRDLALTSGQIRTPRGGLWFVHSRSTCSECSLAGYHPICSLSSTILVGRFWTWLRRAAQDRWGPITDQQDLNSASLSGHPVIRRHSFWRWTCLAVYPSLGREDPWTVHRWIGRFLPHWNAKFWSGSCLRRQRRCGW